MALSGFWHKKKELMRLNKLIQKNLVIWFLGTLLTGFLAGVGTYNAILEIANLTTISRDSKERLLSSEAALEDAREKKWDLLFELLRARSNKNSSHLKTELGYPMP